MKNLINNLLEKHREELETASRLYDEVEITCTETTSKADCRFLQLMCLEKKPKKILEIGTFVGNSGAAMVAAAPEATLYTCDNKDAFKITNSDMCSRIVTHPQTWSHTFLDNSYLMNADFIFNDAQISLEDCEKIYELSNKNFVFSTHDYYNSTGGFEKGHDAISKMMTVLERRGTHYNLYIPEKEWYFTGAVDNINGCTAMLEYTK